VLGLKPLKKSKKGKDMADLKVVNNIENRSKLAQDIVDSWGIDDLVIYALDNIEENLRKCNATEFDNEWREFYEEET